MGRLKHMAMEPVDTFEFIDQDSGDQGAVIVRAGDGMIALCLSLKSNGDIEVFLSPKDTRALIAARGTGIGLVPSE